ncbi:hypothetical protein EE612_031145 [Oryza sativa]|nr:hypothetical protein EE612_031145 [Oryza sativa]
MRDGATLDQKTTIVHRISTKGNQNVARRR